MTKSTKTNEQDNINHNENFDLEEIVLNTNQNDKPKITNSEIVKKIQQSNIAQNENLDTVIMTNTKKRNTSNTRTNKINKEIEAQKKEIEKNTETIDDILIEQEEKSKNGSRILAIIIIILLAFGLVRLIRQNKGENDNNNTTLSGNNITEKKQEDNNKYGQADDDNSLNNFLNRNKKNNNREELGGNYSYNKEENTIYYKDKSIQNTDKDSFKILAKEYAKDKKGVYYKGQLMPNVETNKFKVIEANGNHKLTGLIVSSKNLLEHLKVKKNREFLMTTIASITNKNQNVKEELTQSSAYAINNFKKDFDELNNLQRGDNMTDLQRAKFGVIFLYIKIIKSLETDQIRMSKAKKELQYFIDHSDEILKIYGQEENKKTSLQGDIGYDEYCVYNDGELFACFLNNIFINKN